MCQQRVRFSRLIAWVLGAGLVAGCSNPSAPVPSEAPAPAASPKTADRASAATAGPVSAVTSSGARKTVVAFLTRSGGVPFHSSRTFEPQSVPFSQMPGSDDVAARLALAGQPISAKVICVDKLSEALGDSLGLLVRSVNSYRAYVEPAFGQTVAFDMVSTTGGVPLRTVGHRTKSGCHIVFYRGGRQEEEKDIEFAPGVEIFPVDVDFIHLYFVRNKDRKEMLRTLFVPEILGFADLTATPEGTETIASGGRNFECAKYLLRTGTSKAREGVTSRQYLWFDIQQATLLKRVNAQSQEGFETVVERVEPERLETLTALVVRPRKMAVDRPFPYPLERELVYRVRTGDQRLGEIRVSFSKQAADRDGPEGWRSRALVNLTMKNDQGVNVRQEEAVTRFDTRFYPLDYLAIGKETAGARADYTIRTRFANGTVALRVQRETGPLEPDKPVRLPDETVQTGVASEWDEPLRRISLSGDDQDAAETRRRVQNERYERPLSENVFVFDYHRVEHLAAALYRLPLPERSKEAKKTGASATQAVAFYAVRQNLSIVATFAVRSEPRSQSADPKTPELFTVTTGNLLLSGRILMDDSGRLLQWTTRCGTQEIVYTLDDPIMQERERKLDRTPAQEGPLLIRPPWH